VEKKPKKKKRKKEKKERTKTQVISLKYSGNQMVSTTKRTRASMKCGSKTRTNIRSGSKESHINTHDKFDKKG
jgi:hypothetical protein